MDREFRYKRLIETIARSSQTLERILEPAAVTSAFESVSQYDQVMNTNITVNYSMTLDLIHRSRSENASGRALDLCSGPGHLSICLRDQLGYSRVTGMDFSDPMVMTATKNAQALAGKISFVKGNALKFPKLEAGFDLVSFTNAGHHFETAENIETILTNAESICAPQGLIMMTDLARLPSAALTEEFVNLAGEDYLTQNMTAMYEDFLASMYASFTPEELSRAVPARSNRVWYQIVLKDLPFFQALVGLPLGRERLFLRPSKDWPTTGILKSEASKKDWSVLSALLYSGAIVQLREPMTRTA